MHRILVATLAACVCLAPAHVSADGSGAGWYLESTETGLFDYTYVAGPFSSEQGCQAYQNANHYTDNDQLSYVCQYEKRGPVSE